MMGLLGNIGSAFGEVGKFLSFAFGGGTSKEGKTLAESTKNVQVNVVPFAPAGGAVASTVTKAPSIISKVVEIGKSLIPATTKGKIIGLAVAPVVASAVISNPIGSVKTVGNVVQTQIDLGKTIAGQQTIGEFVSEHPVATAVLGTTGVVAVGKTVGTLTTAVIAKELLSDNNSSPSASPIPTSGALPVPVTGEQLAPQKAITPETQVIEAGRTTTRRRTTKKKVSPSINQRVNVIVSNRSSSIGIRQSKKYINREVLLN